jgi:hypothetical protein
MPAPNRRRWKEMVGRFEELIEQAVNAGVDLDEIEERIINAAPVDEEWRAALWLYAEALGARHGQPLPARFLPVG